MAFTITILEKAKKELAQVPKAEYCHIRDAIRKLADNPRPVGSLKLSGRDGIRIRCGNYRIIYEINDATEKVTILHIGHRRDVYR
ncbi:MAG: type II toxin-antitoxin system RelE family toxin [Candidatus Methylumidiphilus sp.]